MYISDLYISNFRSIKSIHIPLSPGRNVLVGKNNAGKSNIIKAMELVLGENRVTTNSMEITDFYATEIYERGRKELECAKELFVAVKLKGSGINHDILRGITYIRKHKTGMPYWYEKANGTRTLTEFFKKDNYELEASDFPKIREEQMREWIDSADEFIFYIHAQRKEDFSGIHSVVEGVIVKAKNENHYTRCIVDNDFRDAFITTTLLPAFREPESQLKIRKYNWYGKLIRSIWDKRDEQMHQEIELLNKQLISIGDRMFENAAEDLREKLPSLVPNSSINFRFISSSLNDIYKGVELYINDGIETPLDEKGTGIQSALIIGLFSYYCSKFHKYNSLIALEEPELFLHPQARRMLSAKLDEFILQGKIDQNQAIITTHSVEFLRNTNIENIIVIKRGGDKSTKAYYIKIDEANKQDIQKLRQLLWNKNAELFFADKVILVEGGEEYLIPAVADNMYNEKGYLDKKNISVIQVGGKSQFPSYIKILRDLDIKYYVIADFDYLERGIEQIANYVDGFDIETLGVIRNGMNVYKSGFAKAKEIRKKILSPQQQDAKVLCEILDKICDKQEYDSRLKELWLYLRPKVSKKISYEDFKDDKLLKTKVDNFMEKLSKNNIMILRKGELEDYFTEAAEKLLSDSSVRGKELGVLRLLEAINSEQYTIRDLLNIEDYGTAVQCVIEM